MLFHISIHLQCRHSIPALFARALYTAARPIATQFPWHGRMDDLTNERSFDSQATWVIDVLGLLFDMAVCITRHWQTSGRLMQELNVCTVPFLLPDQLFW